MARAGGEVAKIARDDLEMKLGENVVSRNNTLNYNYKDQESLLENSDTKE